MSEDDDFIRQYTSFVSKVVRETRGQLGLSAEVEDLMAYGYEGLLDARRRFEPAHGVQFKTFAYYRVRGAILNGARAMGRLSRYAQARLMAAEAIDAEAEPLAYARARLGGLSTGQALSGASEVLSRAAAAYTAAIGLGQESSESPEEALERRERRARLVQAVASLPERERKIIEGHYAEGRRLDDVLAELRYSRSGGRSAHGRTLALLYAALRDA